MSSVRRELRVHQKLSLDDCIRAARPENDYYQRLGLNRAADKTAITTRYREIAKVLHPDLHHERVEEVQDAMKSVNEAFDVLGDDDKKRDYDRGGWRRVSYGQPTGTKRPPSTADAWRDFVYNARAQQARHSQKRAAPSKADILDAATKTLAVYDIGRGLTALTLLVHSATQSGTVTREDFRNYRPLQQALKDHALNIWVKSNQAVVSYGAYIEVLKQLGIADVQPIHDSIKEFIVQHAQKIWQNNDPLTAVNTFVDYCKHLKKVGAITPRELAQNPNVQHEVKLAAAKVFKSMQIELAPACYGMFVFRCIGADIISPRMLHDYVRPIALLRTKDIFKGKDLPAATKKYGVYVDSCERIGLFTRKEADEYLGVPTVSPEIIKILKENFSDKDGNKKILLEALLKRYLRDNNDISDR